MSPSSLRNQAAIVGSPTPPHHMRLCPPTSSAKWKRKMMHHHPLFIPPSSNGHLVASSSSNRRINGAPLVAADSPPLPRFLALTPVYKSSSKHCCPWPHLMPLPVLPTRSASHRAPSKPRRRRYSSLPTYLRHRIAQWGTW
jgi:hypothetical protein